MKQNLETDGLTKGIRTILHSSVASLSLMMITQQALAQASTPEQEIQLDEIVVTAQKRTENLRDVPISITAIGKEELEKRGITNVEDIQFGTPNVITDSDTNFNTNIIIRGIGSEARNIGFESSLGTYIDGVYQGRNDTIFQDLGDAERVEVLRGPQGTLFGKNTISGAISITTKKPTDTFEGGLNAEFGNYNAYRIGGNLSGPIVGDAVFAKFSAFRSKEDGYVTNISPTSPPRAGGDDSYGFRGAIRLKASDNLEFTLRGDYSLAKTVLGGNGESFGVLFNLFEIPDDSVVPGIRTINTNGEDSIRTKIHGFSATADWNVGDHTVTAISAFRKAATKLTALDLDLTSLDYLSQNLDDRTKFFSQEVRLASPSNDRFKYVIGAYFYKQKSDSLRETVIGLPYIDLLQAIYGFLPEDAAPDRISTSTRVDTTSLAAFANASFDITSKLSLIGGLRVTRETKKLLVSQFVPDFLGRPRPDNPLGPDPSFINLAPNSAQLSQTEVSPTVGLQFKVNDRANVYARYSKGFKSGGWNVDLLRSNSAPDVEPDLFDPAKITFKPESVANFEIGFKGDLLDRRLRISAAAFLANYKDIQIARFVGGLEGYATDNAKARIKGAEFELTALPAEGLTLSANLGFTDAKYLQAVVNSRGEDDCGGDCVAGDPLGPPKWTIGIGVGYEKKVTSTGTLSFRLDYAYRSDDLGTLGSLDNPLDPLKNIPEIPDEVTAVRLPSAYSIVDGRIAFALDSGFELSLWGKNLFNKTYITGQNLENSNQLFFVARETRGYGAPRTFGVRASYQF
jgi:iron complex outermembrane recepter protein